MKAKTIHKPDFHLPLSFTFQTKTKNKIVGISKLNFALSFSQLESLDRVSWLLPNGKAKYSEGGCVCSKLCGKPGFPFLHVSFP